MFLHMTKCDNLCGSNGFIVSRNEVAENNTLVLTKTQIPPYSQDLRGFHLGWNQSRLSAVTLSPLYQFEWHTNNLASLTKMKGRVSRPLLAKMSSPGDYTGKSLHHSEGSLREYRCLSFSCWLTWLLYCIHNKYIHPK